jgi:hypothetical protein
MTRGIFGGLGQRMRQPRGIRAWMFIFGMALFSAAGWMRMIDTLNDWYWLDQVAAITPGPLYLTITGGLWGVAALAAVVWVLLRLPRWRSGGLATVVFIASTYWADRLLVTRAEDGFVNAGFSALLTILGIGLALLLLLPFGKEGFDGVERSRS